MDFTSSTGVRFKIYNRGACNYTARYYSGGSKWPRTYRYFHCPTDETRREMFYILGHTKLCTECKDVLIEYKDDNTVCNHCVLQKASQEGLTGDSLDECPVCYHKLLTVDNTKATLPCKHAVCSACLNRLKRVTHTMYADPIWGPVNAWAVTCPMCRDSRLYNRALQPIHARMIVPAREPDPLFVPQ